MLRDFLAILEHSILETSPTYSGFPQQLRFSQALTTASPSPYVAASWWDAGAKLSLQQGG